MNANNQQYPSLRLINSILLCAIAFIAFCIFASYLFNLFNAERMRNASVEAELEPQIVIDAGHGGEDCGAIGINGVLEKDLNLKISELLSSLLELSGVKVVKTRTTDTMLYDKSADFQGRKKILDMAARLQIVNDAAPDILVSIHMNAYPEKKYSGLTVYYSPNTPTSHEIATRVSSCVKDKVQPNNNRETKSSAGKIYLLDRASCPAILIECGFISNPDECAALCDAVYRQKLTLVIYSSLTEYLFQNER